MNTCNFKNDIYDARNKLINITTPNKACITVKGVKKSL